MSTRGLFAAMVTPMRDGGQTIDEDGVLSLAGWLVERGVPGLFVLGTTGEGLMLDERERLLVLERVLEATAGSAVTVIAHCGAQTTSAAVSLAYESERLGVDAVAAMAPPFYPLDDRALTDYFAAVASSVEIPFLAYQIPSRNGHDLTPEFLDRLREQAPNLTGVKDTTKSPERLAQYIARGDLDVLVGSEELMLEALEMGAAGATSAVATAYPEIALALLQAHEDGRREDAVAAQAELTRLRRVLRQGPDTAAFKQAVIHRGVDIEPAMRPPLRPLDNLERDALEARLTELDDRGALRQ